jgi:ubiquinone/menaquinone biosynthesis C-methylase UbiE
MAPHVCPWWVGYLLMCPLRTWLENPVKLLKPLIKPGLTVLDVGSGMGFFTFPAARLVGDEGRVIAVDVQQKMLDSLQRRAEKAGLGERVTARLCRPDDLNVTEHVDVCLAINVADEVPDVGKLFSQIVAVLKPQGKLLLIEPKHHVSQAEFEKTVDLASREGLRPVGAPDFGKKLHAVLELVPGAV